MPPTATPVHTHTHTTPSHSQDNFVCLPPIRPVYFLSPHYEAVRGATALSHFQIYAVVTRVAGVGETCMNQREKGRSWASLSLQHCSSIYTVKYCFLLWGLRRFNCCISQAKENKDKKTETKSEWQQHCLGAYLTHTDTHILQSDFTFH